MSESDDKDTRGWDSYWAGAGSAEAYSAGGVSHPVFPLFWDSALGGFFNEGAQPRIVDIATGNGAVLERLQPLVGVEMASITCVDISKAAIDGVTERFPGVTGVVADAASLQLPTGEYDLVTSQFGIEYAGATAFDEAMRLTTAGGSLIFVMHIRPGGIYDECAAALDAVRRTQRCEFVPRALAMFEAGFAAVRGADRQPYDDAGARLSPAIRELESILSDHGNQVAGDTVARLYADVSQIHSRIQHYEPDDVLGWLSRMTQELEGYEARMASMCEAAKNEQQFAELTEKLQDNGFVINRGEALLPEGSVVAMAWVLWATRAES